jgi:hypothetical protein
MPRDDLRPLHKLSLVMAHFVIVLLYTYPKRYVITSGAEPVDRYVFHVSLKAYWIEGMN